MHVCHAAAEDIAGFQHVPVAYHWRLVKMPSAPLIRFEAVVFDDPLQPYLFESFLNVADPEQAKVLAQLANQEHLFFAFYGDDLTYRFTQGVVHSKQQWQQLDEITAEAEAYWQSLPSEQRDFDRAKADFMRQYPT